MTTYGAAPSAPAGGETAPAGPRPAGRPLATRFTSLTVVLLAGAWVALCTHPQIEVTGASWADPRLVEWPDLALSDQVVGSRSRSRPLTWSAGPQTTSLAPTALER